MAQGDLAELWVTRIRDYQASGEQAVAWCRRHQVTTHQLYYWMRKLKSAREQGPAARQPQWVSLRLAETASGSAAPILVKIGTATIEVRPGFDPTLLADVVRALKTLC